MDFVKLGLGAGCLIGAAATFIQLHASVKLLRKMQKIDKAVEEALIILDNNRQGVDRLYKKYKDWHENGGDIDQLRTSLKVSLDSMNHIVSSFEEDDEDEDVEDKDEIVG